METNGCQNDKLLNATPRPDLEICSSIDRLLMQHNEQLRSHIDDRMLHHERALQRLTSSLKLLGLVESGGASFPAKEVYVEDLPIPSERKSWHAVDGHFLMAAQPSVRATASMVSDTAMPTKRSSGQDSDDTDSEGTTFSEQQARMKRFAQTVAQSRVSLAPTDEIVSEESHGIRVRVRDFVRLPLFDCLSAVLIVTNAIFIGVQVEYQAAHLSTETPVIFNVLNTLYTIFFAGELLLRCFGEGLRMFWTYGASWNWFDLVMVLFSGLEVITTMIFTGNEKLSVLRMIRILRIVRVMRVIRLIRFFRALRILVHAIFHTLRSCFWALLLLFLILFVFAVLFTQAVSEHLIENGLDDTDLLHAYYGNLPRAVFTLFKSITSGVDWEEVVNPLVRIGPPYVTCFLVYFSFVYFAVMNVVTGLFCQSAIESAQRDHDDVIVEQLKHKEKYINLCKRLFQDLDASHSGELTVVDFEKNLDDKSVQAFFNAMDLEISDAWTLFNLLDADGEGSVDLEEFVVGCLRMRGSATGLQIAQMQHEMRWMREKITAIKHAIEDNTESVEKYIKQLRQKSGIKSVRQSCRPRVEDSAASADDVEKFQIRSALAEHQLDIRSTAKAGGPQDDHSQSKPQIGNLRMTL